MIVYNELRIMCLWNIHMFINAIFCIVVIKACMWRSCHVIIMFACDPHYNHKTWMLHNPENHDEIVEVIE